MTIGLPWPYGAGFVLIKTRLVSAFGTLGPFNHSTAFWSRGA